MIFDVTDEAAVLSAAQQVREQLNGETLFGLVNNAGIAIAVPLIHIPTDDFRHQLEVNLVSILIVTKAFVPLLGSDRSMHGEPGRIINISSVGGKHGSPFLSPYVTSKHGLEGFSESLRREWQALTAPNPRVRYAIISYCKSDHWIKSLQKIWGLYQRKKLFQQERD